MSSVISVLIFVHDNETWPENGHCPLNDINKFDEGFQFLSRNLGGAKDF